MNSYFNIKKHEIMEGQKGDSKKTMNIPPFIRTKETGDKVFLAENGSFHWITSPEILQALGGNFGVVKTIDRSEFKYLVQGERITMDNVERYKVIQDKEPEKVEIEEKEEFRVYDEAENAPKAEPEKGLTSIIIPAYFVHYPAFHFTGNCIGSIREHTNKDKTPYEIILVINGNKDAVVRLDDLRLTYTDKVIVNEENLGYAKAVNQGIRVAKGEYIAIINNDVMVYDQWLSDLQACLNQASQLDLVMATPMYGRPFARAVEAQELAEKESSKFYEDTFSDFVDFSCVLTRKEMFNKIGLFNEEFFMYGEDLDLMRRMKKEGLKYASTKRVNTTHIIGATSSSILEMPEIMDKSKARLKEIWGE